MPACERNIAVPGCACLVGVIPSSIFALTVDEELTAEFKCRLQGGNVFLIEFAAKQLGFGHCVCCDGMFVRPATVFKVGCELTPVLFGCVSQVDNSSQNGLSEFVIGCGSPLSKKREKSQAGHANSLSGPRAVGFLGVLEIAEGLQNGLFGSGFATCSLDRLESVFLKRSVLKKERGRMLGFELPLYLSRQRERQTKQDDWDFHGVMRRADNVAQASRLYFAEDTQKRLPVWMSLNTDSISLLEEFTGNAEVEHRVASKLQ